MKKIIYLVVAALMCSCSGGSFTLTGEVARLKVGDSLTLVSYADHDLVFASAVVEEENQLKIAGTISEPTVAALVCNGNRFMTNLFLEPGDLSLEFIDNRRFNVAGSKFNDANVLFNDELSIIETAFTSIDKTLDAEVIEAKRDSIHTVYRELVAETVNGNLDNLFGVYIFATEQFNLIDAFEAKEIIESFSPSMQKNENLSSVIETVDAILRTEVGQPYIDIELENTAGEAVSISSLLAEGKYVLVDFWATWCGPCQNEMPFLKEAHEAFSSSEKFEIYAVSVDKDYPDWANFLHNTTLPWVNVRETDEREFANAYGLRTIPTNFLISPDGEIVAKNLRGEGVMTTLEEFVK